MEENSSFNSSDFKHIPVMAEEVITAIASMPEELKNKGIVIDTTLGGGGHSELILEKFINMKVIGLDQDPFAREAASIRLDRFGDRIEIIDANFSDFRPAQKVNFIIADLGVSSFQLDEPLRGFSIKKSGPIDMRMNPKANITASDLINNLSEKELADLIYEFGEERLSRQISRKIKAHINNQGKFKDTQDLAYTIAGCYPKKARYGKIHPATRTFQALRIAVNNELKVLSKLLNIAPEWLQPEGLLNIISFHSLEDRLVKRSFVEDKRLQRITKKPLLATQKELEYNPRSRSAKYRIAKRIDI